MISIIQSLQNRHLIWHANDLTQSQDDLINSGYQQLDHKLGGGWPDKGIIELQAQTIGIGEVRLLLPALLHLSQQKLLYVWIAPPGRLNAQALAQAGLPLDNMLVATNVDEKEAFWLSEKCLSSGCCAAVILWTQDFEPNQAKRLQLAAKEGSSLGFVIRPPSTIEQSLPISVRMKATANKQGLQLQINKRLGGYPVSPFTLDMRQQWPNLTCHKNFAAPVTQIDYRR